MKGESAIWNALMSAAGASFAIVAIALVVVAARSSDPAAGDTPDAAELASADSGLSDAASAEALPAQVVAMESATAAAPAAAAEVDASAAASMDASTAAGDAGPSEHDDEADAGAAAAASVQSPPPVKSPSTKTKPTKRKTKRPR